MDDTSTVQLPAQVRVSKFAEARIKEIQALTNEIAKPRQGEGVAQQLPHHLRRRAVSHHSNRLPRRLRAKHIQEREKSTNKNSSSKKTAAVPKRPSRKYRRRPANLLLHYNRRQQIFKWLETHIWHAKRFHMTSKYGYRLPDYPNDKSFRPCYRAAAKKCLLFDLSYYAHVELSGPLEKLTNGLSKLTRSQCGSGFNSPDLTGGQKQGQVWLYKPNVTFPHGAIGKVTFLWKPANNDDSDRTVWIWCHPAYYDQVFSAVKDVFELEKEEENEMDKNLEYADHILEVKMATRNVASVPIFKSANCSGVKMSVLTDTLNRFRLVGPLSQVILSQVLQSSIINTDKNEEDSKKFWWQSHFGNKESLKKYKIQCETLGQHFCDKLPGHFPPGTVIGHVVRDPRKLLPPKRFCPPASDPPEEAEDSISWFADSPIWSQKVRGCVTTTKCSDQLINTTRSELLTPGSQPLALTLEESRIPLLLIKTIDSNPDFGSGWDLILPSGWAMSFWLNFVFRGARVGGQRELRHLSLEQLSLPPILDAPDSQSGLEEIQLQKQVLTQIHLSHPPDKRPNFSKLGSATPFAPNWPFLIKDWTKKPFLQTKDPCNDYYVVRDCAKVAKWRKMLALKDTKAKIEGLEKQDLKALLPVKVVIDHAGTVGPNTMICWPSRSDHNKGQTIMEPLQHDENAEKRKSLKQKHLKEKAKLRRHWKALKAKMENLKAKINCNLSEDPKSDSEEILKIKANLIKAKESREECNKLYVEDLKKLWLDEEDFNTVKDSATRPIMGFVTFGDLSFRQARHVGLGFVAVAALVDYLNSLKMEGQFEQFCQKVLLRKPDHSCYHMATMSIIA